MTVSIGNQPVTALSIGNTPVTKVWIGNVLYWQSGVDINLAPGDFTPAGAAAKGWAPSTYLVQWYTSYVRLFKELNSISFPGYINNIDVPVQVGASYTFRAYMIAEFGSGSPGVRIRVGDAQGQLDSSQRTTVGWVEVTFTAREELMYFGVESYNATNTNSQCDISQVQLIKN